jgi:hypothetical protein
MNFLYVRSSLPSWPVSRFTGTVAHPGSADRILTTQSLTMQSYVDGLSLAHQMHQTGKNSGHDVFFAGPDSLESRLRSNTMAPDQYGLSNDVFQAIQQTSIIIPAPKTKPYYQILAARIDTGWGSVKEKLSDIDRATITKIRTDYLKEQEAQKAKAKAKQDTPRRSPSPKKVDYTDSDTDLSYHASLDSSSGEESSKTKGKGKSKALEPDEALQKAGLIQAEFKKLIIKLSENTLRESGDKEGANKKYLEQGIGTLLGKDTMQNFLYESLGDALTPKEKLVENFNSRHPDSRQKLHEHQALIDRTIARYNEYIGEAHNLRVGYDPSRVHPEHQTHIAEFFNSYIKGKSNQSSNKLVKEYLAKIKKSNDSLLYNRLYTQLRKKNIAGELETGFQDTKTQYQQHSLLMSRPIKREYELFAQTEAGKRCETGPDLYNAFFNQGKHKNLTSTQRERLAKKKTIYSWHIRVDDHWEKRRPAKYEE